MYNTLNDFLKQTFHTKVAKLSLDGGFTCPNRENGGGCTFCSERGSGEYAGDRRLSIAGQIAQEKERMAKKWKDAKYIAYFQAFTNTYAPVEILRQKYEEALSQPDVVGLAVATRPDCLGPDVLSLFAELQKKTFLWVELGFQTAREETARSIRRGYDNACFAAAVEALHALGVPSVAHTILGLPGEAEADMLATMDYLNRLPIWGIKLHLLYVTAGTPMAADYAKGAFESLSQEAYIRILCRCVARLRPDIVIHRLTGDGPRDSLIAPLWSLKKWEVLNAIHEAMRNGNIIQGKDYSKIS